MADEKGKVEEGKQVPEELSELQSLVTGVQDTGDMPGLVGDMIKRAPAKVRLDRAQDLYIEQEMKARNRIEMLQMDISKKSRKLSQLYDFSGDSAFSMVTKDVDCDEIENMDEELSLEIRNLVIQLGMKKMRYNDRFGKKYELTAKEKAAL